GGRVSVSSQAITLEVSLARTDLSALETGVRGLASFLERLERSGEAPVLLIDNALGSTEPELRRAAVLVLTKHPELEGAQAALRTAKTDADPRVRLAAAKALGGEGHDAIEDLAKERSTPPEVRQSALAILVRDVAPERAVPILLTAFGQASWWMQVA